MTAPESKSSKRKLRARERELRALALRLDGSTYTRIGEVLGFTRQGAYRAVTRTSRTLGRLKGKDETRRQLRRLELERLDVLFQGIYPFAIQGDIKAIDLTLKIMELRERLLGLTLVSDHPMQSRKPHAIK